MKKTIILLNGGPSDQPNDMKIGALLRTYVEEHLPKNYSIVSSKDTESKNVAKIVKDKLGYTGNIVSEKTLNASILDGSSMYKFVMDYVARKGTTIFVADTAALGNFITVLQNRHEAFPQHPAVGVRIIDADTKKLILEPVSQH